MESLMKKEGGGNTLLLSRSDHLFIFVSLAVGLEYRDISSSA